MKGIEREVFSMRRTLSVIVAAAMILSTFTGTAFANPGNGNGNGGGNNLKDQNKWKVQSEFKDMNGHWGKRSVEKVQNLGIFGGYADGSFQPDKALTQAELAVIIDRLLQLKNGDEEIDFDDIEGLENQGDIPDWARKSIMKGFQKHYFNFNRFHSQVQVDRLTACVALAKALELEPVTDFSDNPFTDRGLISDEDYGYLLALYEEGYITGYSNGYFNPNLLLSRAQMAAIIDRLMDELDADVDEDTEEEVVDDEIAPDWDRDSVVTATAIRTTSVDLKWSGADDDVKVVGYKVLYKLDSNNKVKYVTGKTTTITGLEPDEEYTFTVEAKDAAGNWSDDGPSVEVTTLEEEEDSEAPTWPENAKLTVSFSVSGMVTLIWPDADDNIGIDVYKIYKDGELIKTVDGDENSANITGLEEDTEYTFKVKAVDEAGNASAGLSKTILTE
jgi:chitodextrinase